MSQLHKISILLPNPWLTPMMTSAFKLFHCTFGYISFAGVNIRIGRAGLPIIVPSSPSALRKVSAMFLNFSAFIFIFVSMQVVNSDSHLNALDTIRFALVVCHFSWSSIISYVRASSSNNEMIFSDSLNQILHQSDCQGVKKVPVYKDLSGISYLGFIFSAILIVLFVPPVVWYTELDPYTSGFSILLSTNSKTTRIVSLLAFYILVYFEMRDWCVVILTIASYCLALRSKFELLLNSCKLLRKSDETLRKYISLRLMYGCCGDCLNNWNMALILMSQTGLVAGIWLPVNGYRFLPQSLVIMSAYAFLSGLPITVFLLRLLSNARIQCEELFVLIGTGGRNKFQLTHSKVRSNMTMIIYREWMAQQQLPVNCGKRFAFSKDAMLNYFSVLNTNITNAILLVRI